MGQHGDKAPRRPAFTISDADLARLGEEYAEADDNMGYGEVIRDALNGDDVARQRVAMFYRFRMVGLRPPKGDG